MAEDMSIDPLERRLEQSFEVERWTRFIQDCQDLEQLRETALALVQPVSYTHLTLPTKA